ncbi:hypothetical protein [Clostridioides difficile]|uniref:hypothetical protein n=1 Tax=Clostridioides difficile TaxID=1496 RepID=UPI001596D91C|nr:hypothetical protein [Clostridioides difficile]
MYLYALFLVFVFKSERRHEGASRVSWAGKGVKEKDREKKRVHFEALVEEKMAEKAEA